MRHSLALEWGKCVRCFFGSGARPLFSVYTPSLCARLVLDRELGEYSLSRTEFDE